MNLAATGTLETEVKVQCLRTIVRGEALCQFYLLSDDVENMDNYLTEDDLLKGFAWFFHTAAHFTLFFKSNLQGEIPR